MALFKLLIFFSWCIVLLHALLELIIINNSPYLQTDLWIVLWKKKILFIVTTGKSGWALFCSRYPIFDGAYPNGALI